MELNNSYENYRINIWIVTENPYLSMSFILSNIPEREGEFMNKLPLYIQNLDNKKIHASLVKLFKKL